MNYRTPLTLATLALASVWPGTALVGQSSTDTSAVVSVATAKDAASCRKYVSGERSRRRMAATKDSIKWNDSLNKEAGDATRRLARECLVRFPLSAAQPADLRTIAELYSSAGFQDSARIAAKLGVQRASGDSARADALLYAIRAILPGYSDSGDVAMKGIAEAAVLIEQLDALPQRYAREQFSAHIAMAGAYGRENPDKRYAHLMRALDAIPKLAGEDRKEESYYIGTTYTGLADLYRRRGEAAQAKAILA